MSNSKYWTMQNSIFMADVAWAVVDEKSKLPSPEDVKITEGTLFRVLVLCNFPHDFCIQEHFTKAFSTYFAQVFSSKDRLTAALPGV